jgi:hypothetical protein
MYFLLKNTYFFNNSLLVKRPVTLCLSSSIHFDLYAAHSWADLHYIRKAGRLAHGCARIIEHDFSCFPSTFAYKNYDNFRALCPLGKFNTQIKSIGQALKSYVQKTVYNSTVHTIIENSGTNHFLTGTIAFG